jgi:hypothetical protein
MNEGLCRLRFSWYANGNIYISKGPQKTVCRRTEKQQPADLDPEQSIASDVGKVGH